MYSKELVKIPENNPKIVIKKKGNSTYVLFTYGGDYKKDKGYVIPKRATIGKVSSQDGMMYPTEKFQKYFPDVMIPEESLEEPYRSCTLKIGSVLVIRYVMDEYGLREMLHKWFGEDAGLLEDLVAYLIVSEENTGQHYESYAFDHPLFSKGMRIYSDSTISRLFSSGITEEKRIGFLKDWNRKRDHKQKIYISYDSTNKNCQAGDIDLVEYGKPKVDRGLPVFNVAIAFDKTNRVPLFYEDYQGSITDISQFSCTLKKVKEYGYKDIGFILDRGYFSKENIQMMDGEKYEFIMMVKGCKSLVAGLIDDYRGKFETNRTKRIQSYGVYGTTIPGRLYPEDTKDRSFHLYYSPGRMAAERGKVEQKIDAFRKQLDKNIGTNTTFTKAYTDYFVLHYDKKGILVGVDERTDVIEAELRRCGYFCIITSEKMTAKEALILYKSRDVSEKLFQADKSFLGSESMYVHSEASLASKIFLEFVALIVRNRIYNLLREALMKMDKRKNYFTVGKALEKLDMIQVTKYNDGSFVRKQALTRQQKLLLSAFAMDIKDVHQLTQDINKVLADSDVAIDQRKEEDEDEEEGTENS